MKPRSKELGILVILILLVVASALKNPNVYSGANLQNTGRLIGIYGIFSLGMGLVIITGGIDLSVGSLFALLGVGLAMMLEKGIHPVLALSITMAGGALVGWTHGLLVTRMKLQPFVVTLCGLLLYRGVARTITEDATKGFGDATGFEWLKAAATGSVIGVPVPLVLLVGFAIVTYVLLHKSIYGRYLFAVGKNEEAARYAGINTKSVITWAYILCGFFAAVSAILLAFYTNSIAASTHGNFYELYAVAAAVLGGCSLRGGEGTVFGILLGTTLLQVIRNLVNLLRIPSQLEFAVMAIVILIGVLADTLLQRKSNKVKTTKV